MTDESTREMYGLKPEQPVGEEIPQEEVQSQETSQEAPETMETVLRIEYVDDGAEKIDVAILDALGGSVEDTSEEKDEELPEAWEMPTGDKKVAVMIPQRGKSVPTARNDEVENGTPTSN